MCWSRPTRIISTTTSIISGCGRGVSERSTTAWLEFIHLGVALRERLVATMLLILRQDGRRIARCMILVSICIRVCARGSGSKVLVWRTMGATNLRRWMIGSLLLSILLVRLLHLTLLLV